MKLIYSAKPHKDGYKITSYEWDTKTQRYTNIKALFIMPDKESAESALKGIESIKREEHPSASFKWEKTQKWVFLTIDIKE